MMEKFWKRITSGLTFLLFAAYWHVGWAADNERRGVERMYVLNCGESRTGDISNWSPGVNTGVPWEFSNHCYLIQHAKGMLLWDTGMSDSIAANPEGVVVAGGLLTLKVTKTLASQLKEIGVDPGDIHLLALSHFHSDHCGNANQFADATLYIQQAEFDAAFGENPARFGFVPGNYDKLRESTMVKLHGDHDVFGDGSVIILSTPGHTPGHQSLAVRLRNTGLVVLSGDLVHFEENWTHRRVPIRNFDRDLSVQSMERIAAFISANKARLLINHDKSQDADFPKAPKFLD